MTHFLNLIPRAKQSTSITSLLLIMMGLLCGLQGISYADDDDFRVELSHPKWVETKTRRFTATLTLEGDVWESSLDTIRDAVFISGIKDLSIIKEEHEKSRWVCTSSCGSFIEYGYWDKYTVKRKKLSENPRRAASRVAKRPSH